MIAVKAWEVPGYVVDKPFERVLKCLISPKLQDVRHVGIGMVILPPGNQSTPHSHEVEEETWFVVSGRGKLTIGDETVEIEPEMLITATPGKKHFITNTGDESLKMLWIFTPAGPEEEHIR